VAALAARYGHELKFESVPELLERFGLIVGEQIAAPLQLA